ncbi:MAG: hypothetical protein ABI813_12250 [Bacteroidota bacterium]
MQYNFYVDTNSEWLHIIYNHDTILRYRLKLKKENPGLAENKRNSSPIASISSLKFYFLLC